MAEESMENSESQRNRNWAVRLCILDGTSMKCYQHGCLSMAGRRMTSADMQMWKGGASVLDKELQAAGSPGSRT